MARITVRIEDEFAPLQAAIVHDGGNAIDITMDDWRLLLPPEELARHPETGPSSAHLLREQHGRLRRELRNRGVVLLAPEPQPEAFGQVFTRDACFAVGGTLFIGAPSDPWRLSEPVGLSTIRAACESVVDLSGGIAAIEGGDVIVGGRWVLVGMNHHTNHVGVTRLSSALEEQSIETVRVPHEALHLDCCLAPLPSGACLYDSDKLPAGSLEIVSRYYRTLIPLDPEEAGRHVAANLLWLDPQTVVSNAAAPRTNALLRASGYQVVELDFSALTSVWGSFRCAVCPIERA